MDEQFALISIMDALKHARNLYELLLHDSLYDEHYRDDCGLTSLQNAISKCQDRIIAIEDSINEDE